MCSESGEMSPWFPSMVLSAVGSLGGFSVLWNELGSWVCWGSSGSLLCSCLWESTSLSAKVTKLLSPSVLCFFSPSLHECPQCSLNLQILNTVIGTFGKPFVDLKNAQTCVIMAALMLQNRLTTPKTFSQATTVSTSQSRKPICSSPKSFACSRIMSYTWNPAAAVCVSVLPDSCAETWSPVCLC